MGHLSTLIKNKIALFTLVFVIIITLGFLLFFKNPHQQDNPKAVAVITVKQSTITQSTHLIGTIQPRRSTVLMAKQTGTLSHHAEAGSFVKTDDLIATLENVDLKNTYNLAKRAEQIAKNAYERTLELSKKNTSSKKNVEQALLEWINAKKDLAKIKIDLDKTLITAPFDGIVGSYKVHDGSQVVEGCPLITFFQPNDLIVEFDVPEPIVSKVKNGGKVFINNKPHTLTHVQKLVDPDTHMAPAFLNYHEKALPGSNVDVNLVIQEKQNTIVIPYESLIIKNGDFCVYVVINKKAELRKVTLGIQEKESIEILTGLKTGEKVILRGQSSLYPGISVKSHES